MDFTNKDITCASRTNGKKVFQWSSSDSNVVGRLTSHGNGPISYCNYKFYIHFSVNILLLNLHFKMNHKILCKMLVILFVCLSLVQKHINLFQMTQIDSNDKSVVKSHHSWPPHCLHLCNVLKYTNQFVTVIYDSFISILK